MSTILLWIILPPLVGALITTLVPARSGSMSRAISVIASLVSLVFAVTAYTHFHQGASGYGFEWRRNWFTLPFAIGESPMTIQFAFGLDGLSMPFVALTTIVSTLALFVSGGVKHRAKQFAVWMQLLTFGLLVVFSAIDVFVFFLALEITLVSMYFLLLLWGGEDRRRVSTKFLVYRGLASVGILLAFIGAVYAAGYPNNAATTDLHQIAYIFKTIGPDLIPYSLRNAIFITLFIAVLIEEALVPFHTWLPDALAESNTPVSMMLGGVLVKTGAYILLRLGLGVLPQPLSQVAWWVALIGVVNIVYAGFVAIVQKDWRRLLAYSTISHMGLVLLGLSALTKAGVQGAIFMTISSALLTALLLFIVGAVRDRTQTSEIDAFGGLSKSLPVLSGFMLAAALGSLGLPGMSGFISEIITFTGTFRPFPVFSAIGVLGLILAALYLLWAIQRTTYGQTVGVSASRGLWDARPLDYVPLVVLLALVIAIGVYPSLLGRVVNQVVVSLGTTLT